MRSFSKYVFLLLALVVSGAVVTGCGSSKKTSRHPGKPTDSMQAYKKKHHKVRTVEIGKAAPTEVADALVTEARTWLGVPYVYGGTTRDGADCSGFLVTLYHDVTGLAIPRTTKKQEEQFVALNWDDVAVGDVLFFSSKRSGGKVAHVGMYVGNNRMIHASSSRGVVEDDLTLNYYQTHFRGAGRVPAIADAYPVLRKSRELDPLPPSPLEIPAPILLASNTSADTHVEEAFAQARAMAAAESAENALLASAGPLVAPAERTVVAEPSLEDELALVVPEAEETPAEPEQVVATAPLRKPEKTLKAVANAPTDTVSAASLRVKNAFAGRKAAE